MWILLFFFILTFCVVAGVIGLCLVFFKRKQKNQIRSMLRNAEASAEEQRNPDLLRPVGEGDFLKAFLEKYSFFAHLEQMIDQAGSQSSAGKVLTQCFLAGCCGFLAGYKFHFALPAALTAAIGCFAGLFIPFLLLIRKRNKNISMFEEQFPEALDFLSRSMRAGHAFSVALEMLATDSPEPLCRGFRRVSNETALGSSLEVALAKLIVLVPIVDVRFFVSSVILQQETGGNLGEILTKLSHIIRERFRLKGQVKAVSAHGRITGLVLLLMPIAVGVFIMISNPKYLTGMAADPLGRMMIYGALGGQVVGYFVINKIIDIKV